MDNDFYFQSPIVIPAPQAYLTFEMDGINVEPASNNIAVYPASNVIIPQPPDLSPYATTSVVTSNDIYINGRIDALMVTLSNLKQKEDDRGDFWEWADPIITGGLDIVGDLGGELFRRWLETTDWKDVLAPAIGDILDDAIDPNNPAASNLTSVRPDFKTLANNAFAVDRVTGSATYGVGIAQDFSFGTNARLCVVPSQEMVYNSTKFGEEWALSMNTTKKVPVIDFGTRTCTLSNIVATTGVTTSNVTTSNLNASNLVIPGGLRSSNGVTQMSNASASNLTIAGKAAVKQDDTVNVTSLTIGGGLYGGINATGDVACSSVNVNGGAFRVFPNGTVSLGGTFVFDGPNKAPIVYDDQILPRSARFRVQDVLSGNLGSTDTLLFDDGDLTLPLPPTVRDNPLSFSDLAAGTRNAMRQALGRAASDVFDWVV